MKFIWLDSTLSLGDILTPSILLGIFFIIIIFIYAKVIRRKMAFLCFAVSYSVLVFGFLSQSNVTMILGAMLSTISVTITLFVNIGDLRKLLASPFKRVNAKANSFKIEKIYDRQKVYKTIEETVLLLSKKRTGAIITFEKNTSFKDIIKNGVPVHAPVSTELLDTIFYPGTRLHDGAVIIHNNEIVAASVFFTPTTKPFAGKYGSRHRAALGISEISDSVTVVVSEETGRISLAVSGELTTCDQDSFPRVFEGFMDGIMEK